MCCEVSAEHIEQQTKQFENVLALAQLWPRIVSVSIQQNRNFHLRSNAHTNARRTVSQRTRTHRQYNYGTRKCRKQVTEREKKTNKRAPHTHTIFTTWLQSVLGRTKLKAVQSASLMLCCIHVRQRKNTVLSLVHCSFFIYLLRPQR